MKIKKSNLIVLVLILSLSIIGCSKDPNDVGMDIRDRNLSTQTRIDNRWDNNTGEDWERDNIGNDLSMRRDSNNFNNGINDPMFDNGNGNLNNGMTRSNNMDNQANSLARDIANLPEVSKASVVVTNDTALVGIALRGNTQNTMTTTLRNKVEKMVKDKNPRVKNVSVTTDPDLYTRIQGMSTKVLNGNPIESFTDEVRDLLNRMGNSINNMTR